jgi:hypothetical protein
MGTAGWVGTAWWVGTAYGGWVERVRCLGWVGTAYGGCVVGGAGVLLGVGGYRLRRVGGRWSGGGVWGWGDGARGGLDDV